MANCAGFVQYWRSRGVRRYDTTRSHQDGAPNPAIGTGMSTRTVPARLCGGGGHGQARELATSGTDDLGRRRCSWLFSRSHTPHTQSHTRRGHFVDDLRNNQTVSVAALLLPPSRRRVIVYTSIYWLSTIDWVSVSRTNAAAAKEGTIRAPVIQSGRFRRQRSKQYTVLVQSLVHNQPGTS